jgi:hypothetical protein
MTNPVGRPRKIESPEKFDELVDSYIALCQQANEPILLTGLILSLGLTSKEGFYELEYEKRLNNGSNAAAPIFALKNFGWADKQEIDHTSSDGSIKPTVIQLVAVDNDDNTDTTS